ncbi:alpha/beta hydrolase [Frateuria aurantia]|uniref:Lysophospholipase n=1 Tax=Frateuria aurantia (strain ATCC 33424 / DSM 6220 / KCTC 2777 / LMG 1558 / NBRC 3245 / NCIMB 13370) TaxID=767434 RepID=H8L0R1_FRAAD|nr:alpha/beta hydrolase [Frateuria aurantia]AFC85316.1 lysophospholipase [Frateuria aurantia DSM 6220]
MKKTRLVTALVLVALLLLMALGPRAHHRQLEVRLPVVPSDPSALQAMVAAGERATAGIRPDNQARIVWVDPAHPAPSACAIIYLHGFGASQGEGAPVHRELARDFGCNLFLPRLPGNGLASVDAMRGIDAQQWLDGAARALAIGHALGRRVIVIGTSMGGGLALELAGREPAAVDALLLYSPLVREYRDQLDPMFWPDGEWLLKYLKNHGRDHLAYDQDSVYWAGQMHIDGYKAIAELRSSLTPSLFKAIRAPMFLGYYWADSEHHDTTVSVPAMLAMYAQVATPAADKRKQAYADAGAHVIVSPLRSKASAQVYVDSRNFLHQVLGMTYVCGADTGKPCPPVGGAASGAMPDPARGHPS